MLNDNVAVHQLPDENGNDSFFAKCQCCLVQEKLALPMFAKKAIEKLYTFYKKHEHCHR